MESTTTPKEPTLAELDQLKAVHQQYLAKLNNQMEQEAVIVLDAQKVEGEMFRQEVREEIKEI